MKKWFTLVVMALMTVGANAQDQTVLETQNSGCLSRTRGYMDEYIPAIVLKKEGSILSVEVQNFISNCATSDFMVNFSMSEGNNGEPCTLSAEVLPVRSEEEVACMCPYNVSFTVRDLEANTFYLNCGWYKGLVELTDGKPLVLKEREDYESLLSESKVWTMAYKAVVNPEEYGDVYRFVETKLVGDTIINDIHFKQKYRRERILGQEDNPQWYATDEYLGQDGGKVYQYSDRNKMMVEDMDMSLNLGDKTLCYYQYDDEKDMPFCFVATVVSDTILNNTDEIKPRKCVYVQLEDYPADTDMWIDGIGSVTLGIDGVGLFHATGAHPKLYKVTDGDAVIYQSTLPPSWVYRPLVVKGKKWTYHHNTYQDVYDYYYTLEGDTVISGKNCLKMYSDNRYNDHVVRYEGSLCEEGKKVYCFYPGLEDGRLLYDFGCEEGNTLKMTGADLIVRSIADVELNGIEVKRFNFQAQQMIEGEDDPFVIGTLSWIEGVGATKDFFNMLPLAGNYNSLMVCEVNGEILYNGVTNGITTVHNDLKSGHAIYDLRGRRLKSLSKGINIIRQSDGTTKKVVVR